MAGEVQVSSYNLNQIVNAVQNIQQAQAQLSSQVSEVAVGQEQTRFELNTLRAVIDDFITRDILAKNRQFAQTEIIEVRQKLEAEFGHYGDVRRLATGLLQATDAGIVATATMRQLSEELMLTAPRYWLAPAVVAIAAWIRDDRLLAERAVKEALTRDHDKAALMFALILRRYRRTTATGRWLAQYVARQNPSSLPREFAIVLDAVATGALGTEARPMVMQHVSQWFDEVSADERIKQSQVVRWVSLIDGMRTPVDARYTVLPVVSPTWPRLKEMYEGSTVHGGALDHFGDLFAGPITYSRDQRVKVDSILDSLVTRFDAEELPQRRKMAELQALIDHHGDEAAAARAVADESATHEERVDILTLLTNAAFFPEQAGVSLGTQRMATAMAKEWISEADGQLHAKNTQMMPDKVELVIEGWRGAITESATQDGLAKSLEHHIESETQRQIMGVKFTGGPLVGAIAGGVLLLLAIVTLAAGSVVGGIVLVLLAAVPSLWALAVYRQLPKRREALRQQGEHRKAVGKAQLNGAIAETIDLRSEWEAQLAKSEDLHTYVRSLSGEAFTTGAADEERMVRF